MASTPLFARGPPGDNCAGLPDAKTPVMPPIVTQRETTASNFQKARLCATGVSGSLATPTSAAVDRGQERDSLNGFRCSSAIALRRARSTLPVGLSGIWSRKTISSGAR